MARVVRGLPSSWDPTTATLYSETGLFEAVWSPCNRVITTVGDESVVILDGATLSRLNTFAIPSQYSEVYWRPSFSPDGHCLTLIGEAQLVSWDLQTGGPLGAIPSGSEREENLFPFSSTYSEDGKAVAVAYSDSDSYGIKCDTFIRTYDLSGTEAGPHFVPGGRIIEPIWTHGKCIRFVTISLRSVAVSEVEFTSKNPPVKVESLPIADKIVGGTHFLFLPSLSQLAFTLNGIIQVWDAKAAKLLLESELPSHHYCNADPPIGSFSSDGRFFVHGDAKGVTRVWKESPAGYVLHQKLSFPASNVHLRPCLSPSGESIFMSPDRRAFHLWHTRDQVLSLPSVSENNFTLAFSPDESFVAFARRRGNLVRIFNPFTGDLQSTVDTNMSVVCLGMTGSALIVVGEEKVVSWDLPGGDCTFNANINDSVRTTTLHRDQDTPYINDGGPVCGSISPDFSRIAVLFSLYYQAHLHIYDLSTGRGLTSAPVLNCQWVGFTWDGREVWTAFLGLGSAAKEGLKIVEDSGSGPIWLEPQDGIVCPSGVFPWEPRLGYEVTADGWVLSATRKRLLWLPHRWRSDWDCRVWSGRFLGLVHKELSEAVILELP